jgi:hypothetical protein
LFKLEEKILSGMRSEFHDLAFLFSHPLNIDAVRKMDSFDRKNVYVTYPLSFTGAIDSG